MREISGDTSFNEFNSPVILLKLTTRFTGGLLIYVVISMHNMI